MVGSIATRFTSGRLRTESVTSISSEIGNRNQLWRAKIFAAKSILGDSVLDQSEARQEAKLVSPGTRAIERCDALGVAPFSESSELLYRRYLTPAHDCSLQEIARWMRAEDMRVRRDAMGNLSGRYDSGDPAAPCLLIGSHIDSVHNAGKYDGPLGIMIGIELVAALRARGRRLPFGIEVIAFGDEEGSRYPDSMMCSRAVAGLLPEAALQTVDHDGVSVASALRAFGCDPTCVAGVARSPGSVLAYIEPHIEQGPVLEMENLPVGIVTAIAAQLRMKARFTGVAGHAGTSPMRLRYDALAAASEGILAVERICSVPRDVVGTVGHVVTSTRAYNVIVGEAELFIDIRSGTDTMRDNVAASVRSELASIAQRRKLAVGFDVVQKLPATRCDPRLMDLMGEAVQHGGLSPFRLISGAGHDAIAVSHLAPTAMLFVRCVDGVSHNPRESVAAHDVDVAINVLVEFILRLSTTLA